MSDRTGRPAHVDVVAQAIARLRPATAADNARILDLMSDVPMEGNLVVATERGPDFFSLYGVQRGDNALWIYDSEDGGQLKGMGGVLVRDGFLDEAAQKVGYLGDLRTRGFLRERLAFPHAYAHLFNETIARTGCEQFLTGVLADNARALRALASSSSKRKRAAQPHYHLLTTYDMVNVHFLRRRRPRRFPGLVTRTATTADLPAITSLLAADHRQRAFGWRFDDGELEHRLAAWPGFTLESTFVCHDDGGRLRGVTSTWDASPVKRYRIMRYGAEMVWVKRAMSVAARVMGTAPLPDVGAAFRYRYLTNTSVLDDDATVFAALLDFAYVAHQNDGLHFLAFPLYDGDPLRASTKGFFMRMVPFHLYAVTSSTRARVDWQRGRPGFEMALA